MTTKLPLKLEHLPAGLPLDNAIRIDLVEGVPIFCASSFVQKRIETLLSKQKDVSLTDEEEREFDKYEELDDYLSLVNRLIRNASIIESGEL
jgi:uncharacterized protein YnzC (UPF0291/DUF896 family)